MGKVTTHVLDTSRGTPAAGLAIEFWSLLDDAPTLIVRTTTNGDGRVDVPLFQGEPMPTGAYELRFMVGAYLAEAMPGRPPFLDVVPIRFVVADGDADYHVPLLLSPYGYSTYRGS